MKADKPGRLRVRASHPSESETIQQDAGLPPLAVPFFGVRDWAGADSARAYLRVVVKRKWLVLGVAVIGAAVAAVISTVTAAPYRATATVLFSTKQRPQETAARTRFGAVATEADVGTQIELFRSIMETVPMKQTVVGSVLTALSGTSKPAPVDATQAHDNGVGADLRRYPLLIRPSGPGALVEVHTRSTRSDFALLKITCGLAAYDAYYTDRQVGNARRGVLWLKDELSRAEAETTRARAALDEFAQRHGIAASEAQAELERREAGAWMSANDELRRRLARTEERKDRKTHDAQSVTPDANDDGVVRTLKDRLQNLQLEYTTLIQKYDSSYYRVALVRAKIQFLMSKIAEAEHQAVVSSLAYLRKEESVLRDALAGANAEMNRVAALGPRYRQLELEVETWQRLCDLIWSECRKAETQVENPGKAFTVVRNATVEHVHRDLPLWVLAGGLLGLVSGSLLVVLLDSVGAVVRHPDDVRQRLGLNILGTLPELPRRPPAAQAATKSSAAEFLVHDDPGSLMAIAVRNVQAAIFLSSFGSNLKTIAVSSAIPGEGKTFSTISLAVSLALDRRTRVLVIDGDLRKPRVHGAFGRRNPGEGLSTLITRQRGDWTRLVRLHRISGLYYVSSGPIPDDPVALLGSPRMPEILRRMEGFFDYIVVDTPPVLGFPDSLLLSGLADATVLVAEEQRVVREDLREAVRCICSVPSARFLGVIINKVRSR